jgi:antitoxin (DNA-binding transcriptional repressor) of toxin-antitoxin stability system
MTTTVGVRELKSSLSRYLRLVAGGENIVVCDHGRPLAILSAAPNGTEAQESTASHLANLAAKGLVLLGVGRKRGTPRKGPRVDFAGAIHDDREERR